MIKKYGEELVQELLKIQSFKELEQKLMEIYPDGFDLNILDKRIRDKFVELANKYDNIQRPIQERKQK